MSSNPPSTLVDWHAVPHPGMRGRIVMWEYFDGVWHQHPQNPLIPLKGQLLRVSFSHQVTIVRVLTVQNSVYSTLDMFRDNEATQERPTL
jgi:hypothetical protein